MVGARVGGAKNVKSKKVGARDWGAFGGTTCSCGIVGATVGDSVGMGVGSVVGLAVFLLIGTLPMIISSSSDCASVGVTVGEGIVFS